MSCARMRISPMRAPAASSSASEGTRSWASLAWASAARPTASQNLVCAVNRIGGGEERVQDVVRGEVVFLLEAGVRDARHDGELLVRVGQPAEERQQVVEAGDAVEFAAHHEGRHADPGRVDDGKLRAHVDVGSGGHRVVEREDRIGECLDRRVVGGAGMVAGKDAAHEGAVDRAAVLRLELGQLLASLGQRRAALAGPDEGVQREPGHPLGMALGERGGAQRARRDAVHQQLLV
ncbi:MAG: hypothetical protein K0R40_1414 [Burkholderiales bacterium]|nr:hypothetical protein [Burkholderiales bacterium]